ncbi:hypothetical protein HDU97_004404 [Phlyctochytrium planicorne]|nr:hypothetical protein HDU97_004404 [Phlyctochytrium planicorne]
MAFGNGEQKPASGAVMFWWKILKKHLFTSSIASPKVKERTQIKSSHQEIVKKARNYGMIDDLPHELQEAVLVYLHPRDLETVQRTCHSLSGFLNTVSIEFALSNLNVFLDDLNIGSLRACSTSHAIAYLLLHPDIRIEGYGIFCTRRSNYGVPCQRHCLIFREAFGNAMRGGRLTSVTPFLLLPMIGALNDAALLSTVIKLLAERAASLPDISNGLNECLFLAAKSNFPSPFFSTILKQRDGIDVCRGIYFAIPDAPKETVTEMLAYPNLSAEILTTFPLSRAIMGERLPVIDQIGCLPGAPDQIRRLGGPKLLRVAAEKGFARIVSWLLENSVVPFSKDDFRYVVEVAALNGHKDVLEVVILDRRSVPELALTNAARSGDIGLVDTILDKAFRPVDISWDNHAALLTAARYGHVAIFDVANLNVPGDVTMQAFMMACTHGHGELVEKMLGLAVSGCDVPVSDGLLVASMQGYEGVVEKILACVREEPLNISGCLKVATRRGHSKVVSLLKAYEEATLKIPEEREK